MTDNQGFYAIGVLVHSTLAMCRAGVFPEFRVELGKHCERLNALHNELIESKCQILEWRK